MTPVKMSVGKCACDEHGYNGVMMVIMKVVMMMSVGKCACDECGYNGNDDDDDGDVDDEQRKMYLW